MCMVFLLPDTQTFSAQHSDANRTHRKTINLDWLGQGSSHDPSHHNDVIKWKHFPRYWPFVRRIHRSPVKGQWRGALMFSLIWAWMNDWVNNREAGDLRRHCAHYEVTVMQRLQSPAATHLFGLQLYLLCHRALAKDPNPNDNMMMMCFPFRRKYQIKTSVNRLHVHVISMMPNVFV